MKIIIKATNIELSPSITQNIEDKIGSLEKFLKQFNPDLTEARIEVGKITKGQRHGEIFRAEVNLSVNGDLIRVEETAGSLMSAVDLVKDELKREIRQYKNKAMTQFIRGARSWKKFWRFDSLARFRSSKVNRIIRRK